jgi:hypothetical protein
MSAAQAILAGQVAIRAEIQGINKAVADLGRLHKTMKKTADNTASMARATKMARGALALLVGINVVQRNIGKFAQALMQTVDAMDQLDKASKRLGMTVNEFQQMSIATRMAGVEFDQLQTGIASMQRNIGMLAMGAGEAKAAFQQLGIGVADLRGKSTTDQLALIADKLNEFQDPAERGALAMKIFGEGGMRLLPFLQQGSAGFSSLTRDVSLLTGELDAGVVDSMVEIKDLLTVFGEARQMASANFFAQFTDIIRVFGLALLSVAQSMKSVDFSGMLGGVLDFNMDMEAMKDIAKTTATGLLYFASVLRTVATGIATFTMIGGALASVLSVLAYNFAQLIQLASLGALGKDLVDTTGALVEFSNQVTSTSAAIVGSHIGDVYGIMSQVNTVHGAIDQNAEGIWNAWNNTRKSADGSLNAFRNITSETEDAKDNVQQMRRDLESFAGMAIEFGGIEAEKKMQQNIDNQRMLKALNAIEANTRNQIQIETY